jgi:hypothetical protein
LLGCSRLCFQQNTGSPHSSEHLSLQLRRQLQKLAAKLGMQRSRFLAY